jgi:rSAM/selenodomain-associated transferase 1
LVQKLTAAGTEDRRSTARSGASAPTLIVFCREPLPGHTKTRLIPRIGARDAAALADAFIIDALAKCRTISPKKLVIAADAPDGAERSAYFRRLACRFGAELLDQGRGSLGARMARAMEPYSAAGAILIGTDTPSLPSRLLARSVAQLRSAPVVLAPSLDGGYYLVGVRGPMPDIFRGVRWGRARVMRESTDRLRRSGINYALGPAWYDVDRWSDVLLLTAHLERMLLRKSTESEQPASGTSLAATCPCPKTAAVLRRLGLIGQGR